MRVIKFLILITLLCSCSSTKNINNWVGNYEYNEESVKALARYNMVMIWTLDIKQDKEDYVAQIEINGQQTYMFIQAKVNGNEEKINLTFDKGIDGIGYDNFKKGDSLLELIMENGKIKTKWNKITPMLVEKFKNDTICFQIKSNK